MKALVISNLATAMLALHTVQGMQRSRPLPPPTATLPCPTCDGGVTTSYAGRAHRCEECDGRGSFSVLVDGDHVATVDLDDTPLRNLRRLHVLGAAVRLLPRRLPATTQLGRDIEAATWAVREGCPALVVAAGLEAFLDRVEIVAARREMAVAA